MIRFLNEYATTGGLGTIFAVSIISWTGILNAFIVGVVGGFAGLLVRFVWKKLFKK